MCIVSRKSTARDIRIWRVAEATDRYRRNSRLRRGAPSHRLLRRQRRLFSFCLCNRESAQGSREQERCALWKKKGVSRPSSRRKKRGTKEERSGRRKSSRGSLRGRGRREGICTSSPNVVVRSWRRDATLKLKSGRLSSWRGEPAISRSQPTGQKIPRIPKRIHLAALLGSALLRFATRCW